MNRSTLHISPNNLGKTKEEVKATIKAASDLENFAAVAGMTGEDFKDAFENNAVAALQKFIGGLGDAESKGESAIVMLQEMGLTETRLRDTLLRAAGAQGVFAESVELGKNAWEENTALADEARQRYGTTESAMRMMKNAFNDIGITLGDMFLPKFAEAAKAISEGALKVSEFISENRELVLTVAKVAAGLLAAKTAFLAIKLVVLEVKGVYLGIKSAIAAYNLIQAQMNAGTTLSAALKTKETGALVANKMALLAAKAAIIAKVAAIKAATAAQWLFNAAMSANPIGLVIAGIAALAGGLIYLYKHSEGFRNFVNGIWNIITTGLSNVGSWFSGIFSGAWNKITGIFGGAGAFFTDTVWGGIKNAFANITGWFSGIFSGAWAAVKNVFSTGGAIFSGMKEGILDTFKAVVNAIIRGINKIVSLPFGGINAALEKLRNLSLPVIGTPFGFLPTIPVPQIPLLEKGSSRTPDTFIAGDVDGRGGELVTNARGYQVFTAAQTNEILDNINRVMAINNAIPPAVSNSDTIGGFIGALKNVAANWTEGEAQQPLPASTNVRGGGQSFTIEYRPTIYINGDKPGDLEERLKENNETLLLMFKDFLRKQRDDEGRMAYA